jgi:hypothetical protein
MVITKIITFNVIYNQDGNTCYNYFISTVIDATLGLVILWVFKKFVNFLSRCCYIVEIGNYGNYDISSNWSYIFIQYFIWSILVLIQKFTVYYGIIKVLHPQILDICQKMFVNLTDTNVAFIIFIVIIPLCTNIIRYNVMDLIITNNKQLLQIFENDNGQYDKI